MFYCVSQLRMNPTTQLEWSLALRSSMWSTKWSNCRFGTLQDKKGSGREKSQHYQLANLIPLPSFSKHFGPLAHFVKDQKNVSVTLGNMTGVGDLIKYIFY